MQGSICKDAVEGWSGAWGRSSDTKCQRKPVERTGDNSNQACDRGTLLWQQPGEMGLLILALCLSFHGGSLDP